MFSFFSKIHETVRRFARARARSQGRSTKQKPKKPYFKVKKCGKKILKIPLITGFTQKLQKVFYEEKRVFPVFHKMFFFRIRKITQFLKFFKKKCTTPLDFCGTPWYHGREEWCDDAHGEENLFFITCVRTRGK